MTKRAEIATGSLGSPEEEVRLRKTEIYVLPVKRSKSITVTNYL